ncbi:Vacuolar protein sorting/targeting protein 10 [Thelohanellus kitauei]|uniref:Vacuolar protein sorting/targeting protein 10 n=1 Tax=Thelohanellus kitauei TaxID=669202 RepID=A0A0C2NH86_THEKT|nr:Vacuolar protein sorting/targeting protein 10 [Thelohanellus kitauei]
MNQNYKLIQLVCNLSVYDVKGDRCPFVINPKLYGVIYANLKISAFQDSTYVSLNDGKSFYPIKFKRDCSGSGANYYGAEFYFNWSADFIKNNFHNERIVKFQGEYHGNCSSGSRTFVSFNGGKSWKMLYSKLEKLVISTDGLLMFGTEKMPGRIWYSFDERTSYYKKRIVADGIIDIIPLESPDSRVISTINYNKRKNIYSVFAFDFSNATNRTCQSDDYETWYVPRYFGNCFQGNEVSYLRKKTFAMCDNRQSVVLPTIKPCPCSREDFPW